MSKIETVVASIIDEVRKGGDAAIKSICARLGDREFTEFSPEMIAKACERLGAQQKETIDFAAANIRKFAEATRAAVQDTATDFGEYTAGLRFAPVQRVACYVPGGRYPLPSTALMTTIPAAVAGVAEIIVIGPMLTDEVIYAGTIGGAKRFFQVGGAQAIAAAAFGTETIPRVDIIAGPGNAYVAEAKRQLIGTVGIDMLAGPSEIAVIADESAHPELLVCDLLSQAEHAPDAICYLLTDSEAVAKAVADRLPKRVKEFADRLPKFIDESVAKISIRTLASLSECARESNDIAPEHLLLHVQNSGELRAQLTNYGALFIGENATVPYGDYCAGPNHTLPTGGTARFSSGLTPLTFLRTQTYLEVKRPAPALSSFTARFAEIEGLLAHADAASARMKR